MKKTQMALAAVALVASTAALADVTISGTLEGAVANTTNNGSYFSGAGGWVAGNNIRFSGSEDLGGGMKAVFGLEAGTDLNGYSNNGGATYGGLSGTTSRGSGLFSREASVGIEGSFGTIKLGRQLSPAVLSYAANGTLGNGHFFVNRLAGVGFGGNVAAPGTLAYEGFWVDNAVTYATPDMSGFSASVMQQMKNGNTNGAVPAGAANDSYTAAALNGALGFANVSLSYETRNNSFTVWGINANTKIDAFSFAGSYHQNKPTNGANLGSFSLEAGYNISDPLMVMVQYASGEQSRDLVAVSAKYALSKGTFAYASYLNASKGVSSSFDTRGESFARSNSTSIVGIAHSF